MFFQLSVILSHLLTQKDLEYMVYEDVHYI